jgi:hypothetical protein
MRRTLAAILALCLAASQACAGILINPYAFGAAPVTPTRTFEACVDDDTPANPNTFSGVDVGAEDANRSTFVTIHTEDGAATFNVTAVTVGGDAAAELVDTAGAQPSNTAIYALANATGTAEDIVVTHSESVNRLTICTYSVLNLASLTPVDTASGSVSDGAEINLDVDTSAGGIVIAGSHDNVNGVTWTWTGVTQDDAHDPPGHEADVASAQGVIAATPRTVRCNSSGTTTSSCASVSMR